MDATPQERSPQGGGFRMGPASLHAVKLGQRLNYDVEFVISEVILAVIVMAAVMNNCMTTYQLLYCDPHTANIDSRSKIH